VPVPCQRLGGDSKRKREPITEEKYNHKVRYYFEADTVAQAVLGGYLQHLIGPTGGVSRLLDQVAEKTENSKAEKRTYETIQASNYGIRLTSHIFASFTDAMSIDSA